MDSFSTSPIVESYLSRSITNSSKPNLQQQQWHNSPFYLSHQSQSHPLDDSAKRHDSPFEDRVDGVDDPSPFFHSAQNRSDAIPIGGRPKMPSGESLHDPSQFIGSFPPSPWPSEFYAHISPSFHQSNNSPSPAVPYLPMPSSSSPLSPSSSPIPGDHNSCFIMPPEPKAADLGLVGSALEGVEKAMVGAGSWGSWIFGSPSSTPSEDKYLDDGECKAVSAERLVAH